MWVCMWINEILSTGEIFINKYNENDDILYNEWNRKNYENPIKQRKEKKKWAVKIKRRKLPFVACPLLRTQNHLIFKIAS